MTPDSRGHWRMAGSGYGLCVGAFPQQKFSLSELRISSLAANMDLRGTRFRKNSCLSLRYPLHCLWGPLTGQFPISFSNVINRTKDPRKQYTAWSGLIVFPFLQLQVASGVSENGMYSGIPRMLGGNLDDKKGGAACWLSLESRPILGSFWEWGLRMRCKKLIFQVKSYDHFSTSSFVPLRWWGLVCVAMGCSRYESVWCDCECACVFP